MLRKLTLIFIILGFAHVGLQAQPCSVNITPNPASVCLGQSVNLTASGGGGTWTWSPATGLNTTNGANVVASPTVNTTYTVVRLCQNGNSDTSTVVVTIKTPPTASFTYSPSGTLCAKTPIQFTGSGTGSGLTYSWNFGDGGNSNQQNPTHSYSPTAGNGTQNYTVTLTVTASNGCTATATQTVTVKQLPSTTMGGSGATTINGVPYFKVCSSNPTALFTFTNTSSTSATNTNYFVDWGDASAPFTGASWGPTMTHTYAIGLYTMTYIVTGGNGCVDTAHYNVFVGSNPAVALGSPGNTDICSGGTLTFPITNTSSNPPGTTYSVTFGDGTAPVTFTHPPPASVSHTFNITSCSAGNGGLTAFASPFPNSFTATITVNNPCGSTAASVTPIYVSTPPNASFSMSASTICVNSSATFTNTSVGYNAASGVCTNNDPVMWSISPSTGWTSGSNFGNTFGLTDPNLWSGGSNSLGVNFNTIGVYTITLITGSTHLCGLDTLTRTICVVPPAQPAFNMTPPNGCAPSTVTVSNTSLGSAGCSSLGYSWVVSYSSGCIYYSSGSYTYSSGSNSAQNPVFTFSTPGNYNITLNVTNACGTVSASQSTVVKDLPYITTSSVSGACGSNTVNPSSYFGFNGCGGTISNYAWTFNNGTPSTGTGASPGNVTFTNAGSNAMTVVATNECGSKTATVYVPVWPIPVVSAGPSMTICSGNPAFLQGSASNGTPSYNYSWSPSGSWSCCPNVYPSSTTTYYLNVSDWRGCSGSDSMIVTVNPTPVVNISASPNPVCFGQPITLIATSTVPGTTFTWSGQGLQSTTGDTVIAIPSSSNTYSVTGTTAKGCTDNDNVYVTVRPLPNLGIIPSNSTICLGQSINLIGSGASTYSWHPGASLNTTTGNNVIATPTVTTTYTLVGTNIYGCIDSITKVVTVNSLPNVYATGPSGTSCPGAPVTLNAFGANTYTWTPSSSVNPTTGSTVTATPTVTTTYIVTGSSGLNCQDTGMVVVTVLPIQPLTVTHFDSTICKGQSIDTMWVTGGANYVWTPSAGLNTTVGPVVVATPSVSTMYYVTAMNGVGCNVTDSTWVTVKPLPVAVAGADRNLCLGASTTLGAPRVWGYSYSWTPSLGLNDTSKSNPIANPSVTTTYYLTKTDSITGCYKYDTVVITSVPLPPAPVATSNSPVCWYSNINLFANGLVGATYNWTGPNGFVSSLQNPVNPLALYQDSGDYYCTQTFAGCTSFADTVHVSMFPAPAALSGVNATICAGQSAPIGGAQVPGSTYSWVSVPGGYSSTAPNDTVTPSVTTTYTISETDIHGCQDSNNVVITVKPLPVMAFTYPNPACATIGVLFTNNSTGLIISRNWRFGDGGISGINSPNHAYANTGTFNVTLTATTVYGCIDSITHPITIVTVPHDSFTLSPHVSCGPVVVNFTNYSSGYNPSYQWNLGLGGPFYNGVTPPPTTYPTPYRFDTTFIIDLQVSNVCGTVTMQDSVIVHPGPHASFGTNVSVGCSPLPIYFSNTSQGLPTAYLWNFGDGSATDTAKNPGPHTFYTGANDTTFTIMLIATNACGVDTTYQTILVHPNTVNAFMNITATAGCAPFTTIVSNYSTGHTTFSWNFGNGTYSTQNVDTVTYIAPGTYTIYLSANNGCSFDTTSSVVTVYPVPNVIATPSPQTVCSGNMANISLSSLVAGTTFNWTAQATGVTGASAGGGTFINQILSVPGSSSGTVVYTITPSPSVYGCQGAAIKDTVTVTPTPSATATPNTQTLCSGSSTAISLSSSLPGTTFSWSVIQNNISGATAGVGSTIAQNLVTNTPTQGTAAYTVTPNLNGCLGSSIPVNITINPVPVVTATPNTQTLCTGASTNIALTSTVAGTSFAWTVSQTGVSGASAGTGAVIAQTLTTTGLAPGNVTYTITPTANGCSGLPITVTVIVNPYPTVTATPTAQTLCSGSATNISLSSNVVGTAFNWTITPSLVAGAANGTGSLIAQTLTTTGTQPGYVTYTIVPSVGLCAGNSIQVTVNVNPVPVVSATPPNQSFCSGGTTNIALNSNVSGTTFAWTAANNGVSGGSNGNGLNIIQTLTTTGTATGITTYTVTPTANGCNGAPLNVPITVYPIPALTVTPSTQTICSGSATNIALSSSVAGTTYSWIVTNATCGGANAGTGSSIAQTLTALTLGLDSATYLITPSANGCPGAPKYATLFVRPIPVVSASPSAQTICNGNSDYITLSSNLPNTSYSWTVVQSNTVGAANGSGSIINQVLNTTTAFPGSVNYTVTPVNNGCSGAPLTIPVTVNPSPSLSIIASQTSVCVGQDITFSFVNPGLSSYYWNFGDGSYGSTNPVHHVYSSNSTTYTATLVGTSIAYGCTDSTKKTITILASPIANISATPLIGCAPLNVSFVNNTPFSSFNNWDFGDGNSSSNFAPNHVYSTGGTFNVTFIAGNPSGCKDTAYTSIYVYPKPQAAFLLNDTFSCISPATVLAMNTSTGANGFLWNDGMGNTNTNTSPSFTYTTPNTYNISLTASNTYGCTSIATHKYVLYPTPRAGFVGIPNPICENDYVQFQDTSRNSVYAHWFFGDGSSLYNDPSPAHTYKKAGLYSVTLVIEGINKVCVDSITKQAYIQVLPKPKADFSADALNTPAPEVDFNFLNNSTNASSYVWDFGDGSAPLATTEANTSHSFPSYGPYRVMLVAIRDNGCTDTIYQVVETNYLSSLYVPNALSPNAGGNQEVRVFRPKGIGIKTYHLQIFSTWGEKVFESTALDEHGTPTEAWDGTFKGELLPQDVYVWKVDAVFLDGRVWKGNSTDGKNFSKTGSVTLLR